jgi:hypothetical protein
MKLRSPQTAVCKQAGVFSMKAHEVKPIWVRPKRGCQMAGCGLTKFYEFINDGRVKTKKVDGMRLCEVASIERLGTELKPEAA